MTDPQQPPYRVLARKYRPRRFDDLIGQEAMVRTLSNAFAAGRIPQAWMLTGVRGVGKTTTARILARGLNYRRAGSPDAPTIDMPELGEHCEAIIEGRHIDVMEIDAASNNGVENIRQINDAVRYSPVSARYKVYIVDEVHMLSTAAFNAFLKTLEEPPPHAKFVFATTEIRKVPVTILSRCQRFDLRRVEADVLMAHLRTICGWESVEAEDEAFAMIARAAEGSVRDALSLLDQAIAHGAGQVAAETVRDMLGLADRAKIIDLFEALMRADLPAVFAGLRAQYDLGADPAVILSDLAHFSHLVTKLKLVPDAANDPALTQEERSRGLLFAEKLPMRVLSRTWQILLAGLAETQAAPRPLAAAEMVLARLAFSADLPTPDEALRALRQNPDFVPAPAGSGGAQPPRAPVLRAGPVLAAVQAVPMAVAAKPAGQALARFEDVVALAGEKRDIGLKTALERDVRLVRFEEGRIELALGDQAPRNLATSLSRALEEWTGRRWLIAVSTDAGAPTLYETAKEKEQERRSDAAEHPMVKAVLARFPGAEIVDIRDTAEAAPLAEAAILDESDLDAIREENEE